MLEVHPVAARTAFSVLHSVWGSSPNLTKRVWTRIRDAVRKVQRFGSGFGNVTSPADIGDGVAEERDAAGRVLGWRKIKCGPLAYVWTGWNLGWRAPQTVSCASSAAGFIEVRSPVSYSRTMPRIIDAPLLLQREQAMHLASTPVSPPGGMALFVDATVAASGIVLTSEARIVAESLLNTQDWSAFGSFRRDRTGNLVTRQVPMAVQRRLIGGPYVMLKQSFDANYGHWLVECLPRLAAVAEHFDLAQCKFIVSAGHGAMQTIYRDSLAAFGIGPAQIVEIGYAPVHVDTLLYPLPMTIHPWVKSPAIVPFLESISDRVDQSDRGKSGPRRVYVTRNCERRKLLNEAAVIEVVRSYGFTVVSPGDMTFAEQVRCFRNAEIVVGLYGANLTNVVFAPRGVTLFALTTEHMQDDFFWDLMDHKRGYYVSLHGKGAPHKRALDADFKIDVAKFTRMLRDIL